MIGNLTTSEKRLLAALDRIDTSIERAAKDLRNGAAADAEPRTQSAAPDGEAAALAEENRRLAEELASAGLRNAALEAELATAAAQLAELSAANEALAQANHQLLLRADSGSAGADEARAALEAENAALRLAREAEINRIGAIVAALDEMLGEGAADSLLLPGDSLSAEGRTDDQETDEGR